MHIDIGQVVGKIIIPLITGNTLRQVSIKRSVVFAHATIIPWTATMPINATVSSKHFPYNNGRAHLYSRARSSRFLVDKVLHF